MARTRKTYQTAFELSAQLDNNYKQTFDTANKKIAEYEQAIQQANQTLKDISGYEKAERQANKYRESLDKLSLQLEQQKAKLQEAKDAYNAVAAKYGEGSEAFRKAEDNVNKYTVALEGAKIKQKDAEATLLALKTTQDADNTVMANAENALNLLEEQYKLLKLDIEAADKALKAYNNSENYDADVAERKAQQIVVMQARYEAMGQKITDQKAKIDALSVAEENNTKAVEDAEQKLHQANVAVKTAENNLADAEQKLEDVRNANVKNNKELEAAQKKVDAARNAVDKANVAYTTQQKRIRDAEKEVQKHAEKLAEDNVQLDNLEEGEKKAQDAIVDANRGIREQNEVIKENETYLDKMNDQMKLINDTIVSSGLLSAVRSLTRAFGSLMSSSMSFDYQMSAVEALANNATSSEIEELTERAKELGETTVFTATESAQALTYLAQAGWEASEMLAGVDAVVQLAAASGGDMAETASIMADTLSGFGYEADQASRVADVLAQAAASSNTNVSLLGETFANSASLAGAMGMEIEDVAAALGVMANSGVKGSRAATAMKNIFSALSGEIDLSSAMGDTTYKAYDENGKFKSFYTILTDLRELFSGMTEQEVIANSEAIAGKRGFNALAALMNATEDEFTEMYNYMVNSYGAAAEMAETRLDNLQGDITLLKSAWEGLTIQLGSTFTPTARDAVQALTDIVKNVEEFVERHPYIVKALGAITAGLTTAVAGMAAAASVMKMIAVFGAAGGPVMLAVTAVTALTVALGVFIYDLSRGADETRELNHAVDQLNSSYKDAAKKLEESTATAEENYLVNKKAIDQLIELSSKLDKSGEDYDKIYTYIDLLNEQMDDLNLYWDDQTQTLSMTNEELLDYAENLKKAAEAEAYYEHWKEMFRQQIAAEETASEAKSNYYAAEPQFTEDDYRWTSDMFGGNVLTHIAGFADYVVKNILSLGGYANEYEAYRAYVGAENQANKAAAAAESSYSNYVQYSGVTAASDTSGSGNTINVYVNGNNQEEATEEMTVAADNMATSMDYLMDYAS